MGKIIRHPLIILTLRKVYLKKIASMSDKILADLNDKILRDMILPCDDTLSRWKLISYDKCILCNEKETILHLIDE